MATYLEKSRNFGAYGFATIPSVHNTRFSKTFTVNSGSTEEVILPVTASGRMGVVSVVPSGGATVKIHHKLDVGGVQVDWDQPDITVSEEHTFLPNIYSLLIEVTVAGSASVSISI